MALMLTTVVVGIPEGYEEIGEAMPLPVLLYAPPIWVIEAYDQKHGVYGVLLHDVYGQTIAFLSSQTELDALCAMIERIIDLYAYFPSFLVSFDVVEQWRSIWWMAQTVMAQQMMRKEAQG
jgi:hypothetical protein